MEEYYSEHALTNTKVLCVGAVTRDDAAQIQDEALFCDGTGFYLYVADAANPAMKVEVLARLASEEAAEHLSRLLGRPTFVPKRG